MCYGETYIECRYLTAASTECEGIECCCRHLLPVLRSVLHTTTETHLIDTWLTYTLTAVKPTFYKFYYLRIINAYDVPTKLTAS